MTSLIDRDPDAATLARIFTEGRTHNKWRKEAVSDTTLRTLYDLVKMGPTSANCSPARFVFVRTPEGRERLRPALSKGNLEKTLSAPVTVLIAQDMEFYEHLPRLFPHADAKSWFAGNPAKIEETAFRNATLQGGYLILAARALGLDAGPMSGFDADAVNAAFFAGRSFRVNFLVNLGHGDPSGLFERSPRLTFAEACTLS